MVGGSGYIPVDADAFALVEVGFGVPCRDALGVARRDEAVEHVGDHLEFSGGGFDLCGADGSIASCGRGASSKAEERHVE